MATKKLIQMIQIPKIFHQNQTRNDATSDFELQSSVSEDPDDSEDDAQSDSSEMGDFIEQSFEVHFVPDIDVERVTVHSK